MVRTRIAPSPTGYPHIGTIYQVLFDYAYAKKNKGKFIIRIEDTDRNRFVEGAEQVIFDSIDWFNLQEDESPRKSGPFAPYRQSERLDIYKKYAEELVEKGNAYYCFCSKERLEEVRASMQAEGKVPMYDKHCRTLSHEEVQKQFTAGTPHVIRMKIPESRVIAFQDLFLGEISFNSKDIDDQVILKSDGFPTYHLGVVVDDHLMEISHIFRGREWIPSTPKHILLYEYFGWKIPEHAHLPLILNMDGKGKLSKRHGHASVDYYRNEGYLPEAIVNYLSNLVWYHPDNKEIYSLDEFIQRFELKKINSQGARFDLKKLEWMNGEYIRRMDDSELTTLIYNFYKQVYPLQLIAVTVPLIKERIKKLSDYLPIAEFFFNEPAEYEVDLSDKKELLKKVNETLAATTEWKAAVLGEQLQNLATSENIKFGEFFMVLRVVITGKKISTPLNESLEILGKAVTLERIKKLIV